MNFSLLGGAALVALPIVLHLIMRQKPKLLEFPALRFIQKRHDVNRRRLLLRHLLLLLLRAGAIVLLACALAQPSINFSGVLGSQEEPVAAALVFDAAPRMEYRHENKSRLEVAQEIGQWLLSQLPQKSEIAVFDTRLGLEVLQDDRGLSEQRIERLETVADSQPLTSVVDKALQLLHGSDLPHKEVYVFTDLSRAAWPADSAAALQRHITDVPGVGIYLIDVGIEEPANYALGEVRLSSHVLPNRSTLEIETELSRTGPPGPPGRRTVELYLLDNEGEQKRDEQSFTLNSGESQRVEFRKGSLGIGTHQGFLRIVGQDALACDDTRFFTVEVKPAWRILVAAPKAPHTNSRFLTQALAPTMFRKRGQAPFDCRVVDLDELAGQSPEELEEYAAVCLLDPTPLEPAVWTKLAEFASDGHGVAIFLGRNARPVDSFNAPQAQELLPGRLIRHVRARDWNLYLAPRDYQNLILWEFRGLSGSIPWHAFPVRRYWQLDKLHTGVGVVLPFSDGRAALLERPLGNGRVLTMTTPVSDDPNREPWNFLPVGEPWPFGMLSKGMLLYLVGSSQQRLNYFTGQTVVLRLDAQDRYPMYQVSTPGGLTFSHPADLKQHVLVIGSTATAEAENYRVQAGGETGVDRGFSTNLAPRQTQLDRITGEELKQVFESFDYQLARTQSQIQRAQHRGRVGRELFPALILAVAAVLAVEHLVANRFYREG